MRIRLGLLVGAIAILHGATALAGTPYLVRDVNATTIPIDADPGDFIDQQTWSFFTAVDGITGPSGRLPWATDGTADGTFSLGTVNTPPPGVMGYQTVRAGGLSYFSTTSRDGRSTELWVTDGTAEGTRLLVEGGEPVAALGDDLLFTRFDAASGRRQLWSTNGTNAGTQLLVDAVGAAADRRSYLAVGGKMYFLARTKRGSIEPWISDGTPAGTRRLVRMSDGSPDQSPSALVAVGPYVLFATATTTAGRELWRIDTMDESVTSVADIATGTASGVPESSTFASMGSFVLFVATSTGARPFTLWRTDGTAAGTREIAGVTPSDQAAAGATFFGPVGAGPMAFLVADGADIDDLWATDGVTAEALSTNALPLAQVGPWLYFMRGVGGLNPQVWRTDGTQAGTRKLSGLPSGYRADVEVAGDASVLYVRIRLPGTAEAIPHRVYRYDPATDAATLLSEYVVPLGESQNLRVFAHARGQLFFDNNDPVTGRELWVSHGTPASTRLLLNIAQETRTLASAPAEFFAHGGQLYFTADDGATGRELWRSDGTFAGTQLVEDVLPGPESSEPTQLFSLGNDLYFFAKGVDAKYRLRRMGRDGGASVGLGAITPAPKAGGSCTDRAVAFGGSAYFPAYDQEFGLELWKTDGTRSGTVRVADINPGALGAAPCSLTVFKGRLYFGANGGSTQGGTDLWSSDGTAAGTVRTNLIPGDDGAVPRSLLLMGGKLYLIATDGTPSQIWVTDGTRAGTQAITSFASSQALDFSRLVAANGHLVFTVFVSFSEAELWGSAGVPGDAQRLDTGLFSVSIFGPTSALFANGDFAFYVPVDVVGSSYDVEPWVTDGTVPGTRRLKDLNPSGPSSVTRFADFLGSTFFVNNAQLWLTDGTTAGTVLLGSASIPSTSGAGITAGERFYFVADDGTTGAELFALENDPPVANAEAGFSVTQGDSLVIPVLANDADVDGSLDPGTVGIVSAPAGGSITVRPDGAVVYAAREDFVGADSFTYVVEDKQGAASAPARVDLVVTEAPGSSGGGGGSWSLVQVLLLLALGLARGQREALRRGTASAHSPHSCHCTMT